jgi:hypothetical protein
MFVGTHATRSVKLLWSLAWRLRALLAELGLPVVRKDARKVWPPLPPSHRTRAGTKGEQRVLARRNNKNPRPVKEAGICVIEMALGYDVAFGLGIGFFPASSAFLAAGQQPFASAVALSQVPVLTFSQVAALDLSQAAFFIGQSPSPACNAYDTATTLRSRNSFFILCIR